jgi:nifR3 family TIM-barrel protein
MTKIGSYELPTNIIMAPMSGCTDLPFRLVAREAGATLCFFEMVDCNSLRRASDRTLNSILKTSEQDRPVAAQLVGADPGAMAEGAHLLLEHVPVPFLDINAACPVNKVTKKKAGAYLLQKPAVLSRIIKRLVKETKIPVTVKLRIGYEKYVKKDLIKIVQTCEESGVSAIFIHGRTMAQLYHSEVNYDAIKVVKDNVSVPVFGSGNIMSPELAKRMLDLTGVDGVMVARGGLGNPFLCREIEHYLKTGELLPPPSLQERKEVMKKHLRYEDKYRSPQAKHRVGVMRKIAIWYLKKFHGAAHFRDRVNRIDSYEEMLKLIDEVGT